MSKTVLFAANRGFSLLSSRRGLIEQFLGDGWQVVLATADDSESRVLVELGAVLEPVVFNRGGLSPVADWRASQRMHQIMRQWTPSLVQCFHAKTVMMGTWAARRVLGDSVRVVNTITGLGHAFIEGGLVTGIASAGYCLALPRCNMTIFQNRDDLALFMDKSWVSKEKSKLIVGSGVPLDSFNWVDRAGRDSSRPVVVMLGRLLNQKGIPEFAEVARRVRQKIPRARFCLAGEEDPIHPDAVNMQWLNNRSDIEYVGKLADVKPLLGEADLLVFPSYYREGVPRVVMEAAATGLATVAFDVPGVREAVHDGETGYLVPDRDVSVMTNRVMELLQDATARLALGRNAHELAKKAFDIRVIQQAYMDTYRDLGVEI